LAEGGKRRGLMSAKTRGATETQAGEAPEGKAMKSRVGVRVLLFVACLAAAGCYRRPPGLWPLYREISRQRFVDLTHAFDERSPHWPGFSPMTVRDLFRYEPDGFWAQEFCHVGQWGTHVDAPAHFHRGLRTVSQIAVSEMIMPLVVIDVHERVERNPDYVLTLADVKEWESRHGPIPAGAFVAMRTDWSKRWPDAEKMLNRDARGISHYPGWTLEALEYLYEARKIGASGHETTDTDPGLDTSAGKYECERYILGQDHFQIELLANLDQVPEAGAIVIVTFPKPAAGSGFPARVFAIAPAGSP